MTRQSGRTIANMIGAIVLLSFLNTGCKHKPIIEPEPPIPIPCSPDTVFFERDILPILISNCALSGCHSDSDPQDGVNLTSYNRVMATADIKPGKADGDLWEAINETKPDEIMPPPPRTPLTTEQKELIRKWMLQGAKNYICEDETNCVTVDMSFNNDIRPILQTYCIGCHGPVNPGGGYNFSNFSGVSVVVNNNKLLGSIRREVGFSPMPQGGAPLPQCSIDKITAWIAQGAKDN